MLGDTRCLSLSDATNGHGRTRVGTCKNLIDCITSTAQGWSFCVAHTAIGSPQNDNDCALQQSASSACGSPECNEWPAITNSRPYNRTCVSHAWTEVDKRKAGILKHPGDDVCDLTDLLDVEFGYMMEVGSLQKLVGAKTATTVQTKRSSHSTTKDLSPSFSSYS
jgi:hypothetical protein